MIDNPATRGLFSSRQVYAEASSSFNNSSVIRPLSLQRAWGVAIFPLASHSYYHSKESSLP
jgi:hypothetical protein